MRVPRCSTGFLPGKSGGTMVLRIEDTDVERSEARFEDQLIADLKWLGLDWDEGPDLGGPYVPYRQSERLDVYREHAERLVDQGKAYLCFCSEEDLQKERERAQAEHRQPIYSGKCRAIDPAEAESTADRGRVLRHPIENSRASHPLSRHRARRCRVFERGGERSHHSAFERDAGLQLRRGD